MSSNILTNTFLKHTANFVRMASTQSYKVIHDAPNKLFYIPLGQEQAYLQYEKIENKSNAYDLQHTVVPESHQGRGIAKVLAKEVFDHFVSNKSSMKLTCWYLQKFFKENPTPEYKMLVIQ